MNNYIEKWIKVVQLSGSYLESKTLTDQFKAVREFYELIYDDILECAETNPRSIAWLYEFEFIDKFTHIERHTWNALRTEGVPAYPQFPVGKYFIDFGIPSFKIGIEADGKDFHNEDRDFKRDTDLLRMGWLIFRISGSDTCRILSNPEYNDHLPEHQKDVMMENFIQSTVDGLVYAIDRYFFRSNVADHPYCYAIENTLNDRSHYFKYRSRLQEITF